MENGNRDSGYPNIAASRNNISSDSIDCGISKLGWCRGAMCQRFASLRYFVTALSLAGIAQGAAMSYFRIAAKEAAVEYGYDSVVVEWLLVSSGIFQAALALAFAHCAQKFHPMSWLGGITILQGVTCIIAIIPAIMTDTSNSNSTTTYDSLLCNLPASQAGRISLEVEQSRVGTLVLLFVLQFAMGMANLAFIIIGLTYIDDNSQSIDSAATIGLALCGVCIGYQGGYFITMIVTVVSGSWWLGWVIIGPLLFVAGTLLALFPRRLVKTVLHQTAQRILEESALRNFESRVSAYIDDIGFFATLKRLFKNRLLMANIVGLMFIFGGVLNYAAQEQSYLRSRFYIPFNEHDGLMDEWNLRFVSYFLMPPSAGIALLVAGLIISKMKLSARTITTMNIVYGIFLVATFVGLIFVRCNVGTIAGLSMGKLTQPYCSHNCNCAQTTFLPVCPESSTVTYFSPCFAGCQQFSDINGVSLYSGCTCAGDSGTVSQEMRATDGACNQRDCSKMWIVFQSVILFMASLLGASFVGKVIIALRSVLPQDKGMALAFKALFIGLFAYVPAKFGYDAVSKHTCIFWTQNFGQCLFQETPLHGNILNILTASLILLGVLCDILVFIFAKNLKMYNGKVIDPDYNDQVRSDAHHPPVPDVNATVYTPLQNEPRETPSLPLPLRQLRPAPKPFVFRHPSDVTDTSIETTSSNRESTRNGGVTYAQVIFPNGTKKPDDEGKLDLRMQTQEPDLQSHHVSQTDVRQQLGSLRSFKPKTTQPPLDEIRPTSPETDF